MSVLLNKLLEKYDLEAVEVREFPGMVLYNPTSRGIYTNGFFLSIFKPTNEIKIASMVWADTKGIQFGYWTDVNPRKFDIQVNQLYEQYEKSIMEYKLKIIENKMNSFAQDFV